VDARSRQQPAVKNLGSSLPKNCGPKSFYICSVLRRLRELMASVCWTKRDVDNRTKALESTMALLRCAKISWTLVHKWLKIGPEFLPAFTMVFCPSLHLLCGINVEPHSKSKWNGTGFVCSSDLKAQMLSRRAALSGNTSLSLPHFLVSFIRHLISELAQWNSTKVGHMSVVKCNLKTHVQNLGYPLPCTPGAPKPPFLDDFAT